MKMAEDNDGIRFGTKTYQNINKCDLQMTQWNVWCDHVDFHCEGNL